MPASLSPRRRRARGARAVCVVAAAAALAGLAPLACAPARATSPAAAPRAAAPGPLFIVGGGRQPPALVEAFVRLAGGAGRARIVVLAMASSEGQAGGAEKARDLAALGARATSVWLTRAQAEGDSAARLLDSATGIWFGGGDQGRLMAVLRGTPVAAAIARRRAAGAVVGGTSAGAAVMSAVMLTGDFRPAAAAPGVPVDTGALAGDNGLTTIARDRVVVADGFGLLPDAVVDQHFLARRRHNRLVSVVLERAPHLGVGIDEGTALVVGPDGRWRVEGASAVVVYDARRATVTTAGAPLGASGVTMHVLTAGSTFDPRTGAAALAGAAAR